ncbi:Ubiquitin domain-containing protein 7SL RNA1 [Cardamine amara subsp. amara]|uniref:Ubiquitin domain-containing protein 7SL RNA1 n=1 Tax=Cardamine amara subsp. amara TaxID=228776 RepID=A0ABD1ARF3_CARAN
MDVFLVFVDTIFFSFPIEVGIWDTVLTIKQKIEISRGISVSKQTLFFQNKILQDHLYTIQCNILPNSHLLLAILPEDFPNHNYNHQTQQLIQWPDRKKSSNTQVLQTNQSPTPLNSSQQIIQWPEKRMSNNNTQVLQTKQSSALSNSTQEIVQWPEKRRSNNDIQVLQTNQSPAAKDELDEFFNSEDWLLMDDEALLTEKTQVSEYTVEEFLEIQDSSVIVTEQHPVASDSFGEAIYGQDSSVIVTEQPPVASDSFGEYIYGQDSSVMVRSNYNELQSFSENQDHFPPAVTNQVVRPLASDTLKEIIDIPESPVKKKIKIGPRQAGPRTLTVMVMPFQEENRRIPVEVNERDKVEQLRNKLAKLQEKGQINLPPEGYIFIHKQTALDQEDKSFWWYQVSDGDRIEIFRAHY